MSHNLRYNNKINNNIFIIEGDKKKISIRSIKLSTLLLNNVSAK